MEAPLNTSGATIAASNRAGTGVVGHLRRHAQLIVGLLVSGWSIWQLALTVDIAEVARHRDNANLVLLGLSFGSIVVSMVIKCIRWRYLFAEPPAPPLPPLLSSLYIGYLMNTILPARIGELVRAVLIGRQSSVGTPGAFASIVLGLPDVVSRDAFVAFVRALPSVVVRAKGLVRFADRPDAIFVWNRVEGRKVMTLDQSVPHATQQPIAVFIGVGMPTDELRASIESLRA